MDWVEIVSKLDVIYGPLLVISVGICISLMRLYLRLVKEVVGLMKSTDDGLTGINDKMLEAERQRRDDLVSLENIRVQQVEIRNDIADCKKSWDK